MTPAMLKYQTDQEDGSFFLRLRAEVNGKVQRLSGQGIRKFLPLAKTVFFFSLFLTAYVMMLTNRTASYHTFLWGLLCGLSTIFIVFNISHDASHHCLFHSKKLNHWLSYSLYLVGGNAYLWNLTHNRIHHSYPNVVGTDPDIHQAAPFVRSSPADPFRPYHQYQLYYAPLLYLLHSLYLIYVKDFEDLHLLSIKQYTLPVDHHPKKAYLLTVLFKLFYFGYSLLIPILVLDAPWPQVLICYLIIHFLMGALLTIVLIPVHMVAGNGFPAADAGGVIGKSWVRSVFENTIDYSAGSRWANFFFGGLNTHLAHHLFPGICHIYLRDVTKCIEQRAAEYGMPYRNLSMGRAIKAHFTLLDQLSHPPNK